MKAVCGCRGLPSTKKGNGAMWGTTSPFTKKTFDPLDYFGKVLPTLSEEHRPLQCMLSAGETIFVPSGWWHLVLNTEDTVAVTGNFMDNFNAKNVVGELMAIPLGP